MKSSALTIAIIIILCVPNFTFISNVKSQGEVERTYLYGSKIVINNHGESSLSLENDFNFIPVFMNTSWQTVYLLTANKPYAWTEDIDRNLGILMDVPPIQSEGNETLTISLKIVKQSRVIPEIDFSKSMNLSDIPLELKEIFCKAEGSWLVDDAMLRSLANDIWLMEGKTENILSIVTGLADWIGVNIFLGSHEVPYYANETYTKEEGDCDDQAILLITLCRILGIPAYLQIGCINQPGVNEGSFYNGHFTSSLRNIGYHGWAMVYIPPWGWLPFDMTLGWNRFNSLDVITSAPIWFLDTIQKMDIIKTDWAGDGRREREYFINSQIYVYIEDELIVEGSENLWVNFLNAWPIWILVVIIAPIAILFLILRREKTHYTI